MADRFSVVIEQDEDGVFIARVPALKGCVTQGSTLDELMVNVREAIELCLEVENEETKKSRHYTKFIGIQEIEVA